jgi:CheY-like chemotaxis protein
MARALQHSRTKAVSRIPTLDVGFRHCANNYLVAQQLQQQGISLIDRTTMAYAFDGRTFGQVLVDTERLAERAREHEGHLARLVRRLEQHAGVIRSQVFVEIQQLCVAAREQRTHAEAMLARLVGRPTDTLPLPFDEEPLATTRRARVLIVDDMPEQRDVAARILELAGFSAITAVNGLDALMVAHYARPAVVLMDVNMPVLDGIEAARLLKSSPGTRHVQVIAYTAWPSFYGGPLRVVFDAVLAKPVTAAVLVATVARLLPPAIPLPSQGASALPESPA